MGLKPLRVPRALRSPSPALKAGQVSGEERGLCLLGVLSVLSPPKVPFLFEGSWSCSLAIIALSVDGGWWHAGQPAIIASSPLPHSRNLTAFTRGAKELLLRDLDQLFLSSDCRHVNRTESLRCGGFTAGISSLSF